MDTKHKNHLGKIISATSRTEPYGQRGKYQPVVDKLNKISGKGWSWEYVRNVYKYGDEASAVMRDAIDKLHSQLTRKPRPRPDEIAKRTLVLAATEPELHRIQKKFATRARTKKLLGTDKVT